MKLINIINEFENKSIERRIKFIESYNFSEDKKNRKYFVDKIVETDFENNIWYNVLIVELAEELRIQDNSLSLLNKYLAHLYSRNHYLIKLSILDYLTATYNYYLKKNIDFTPLLALKNNRLIVKNQILLFLILADTANCEKYVPILIKNIKKTKDYRSHIRTYNFIGDYLTNILSKTIVLNLIQYSQSKKLGNAVRSSITELLAKY